MRIFMVMIFVWAISLLQTNGTETESSESTESMKSVESSDISTTTEIWINQTLSKSPFQLEPNNVETTTSTTGINIKDLSAVLKQTIYRIRQKYKKIDVVFLLDASSSVGKSSFLSELKFVRKFLSDFNVSYNYTRVSLVTFSSQGKIVSENCILEISNEIFIGFAVVFVFLCSFDTLITFRRLANITISANYCTTNYRKSVLLVAAPSQLALWNKRRYVRIQSISRFEQMLRCKYLIFFLCIEYSIESSKTQ